jgi:hypothetical protein
VIGLSGALIDRAVALERTHPELRLYDCSAWALAEGTPACILLTGDGRLRAAVGPAIEVHGVLWAVDQVQLHRAASLAVLRAALVTWSEDQTVWLPAGKLQMRQRRLSARK